jgi:RNA recognition motif-containing protein
VSKVFVGNLSFETTREEIEALFAPIGEIVEIVIPTDRDSGRPRGFAFVTFANADHGGQAIEQLDGREVGGRGIRVTAATERPARSFGAAPGGYSRPFSGGGRPGGPGGHSRPKGSRRNVRARKRSIW